MKISLIIIFVLVFLAACNQSGDKSSVDQKETRDTTLGTIEIYDTSALRLVDTNAVFSVIGSGYTWSEGPVWIAEKQMLLFSDVPENKIFEWRGGDSSKLYLTPSGYTDTAPRDGENGSNGLALDKSGKLLLCQSGNRHVSRLNSSWDQPEPNFTVLASGYNGKKFNSPNDLTVDRNNNIYFTDPIYGLPRHENDPTRELAFEGVYKISAAGKLTLLIDSIPRPNGIGLSKDEKTLYIASSDNDRPAWYAYQLNENGTITSGGLLLDARPLREKASVKQGPDGFKLDNSGNIVSSGPDGINIISPAGKLLGLIKVKDRSVSNCAFNEDKSILFITADDAVLKVVLRP